MRPLTLEELDQVAGGQPWDSTDDCQVSFVSGWIDPFYNWNHAPAATTTPMTQAEITALLDQIISTNSTLLSSNCNYGSGGDGTSLKNFVFNPDRTLTKSVETSGNIFNSSDSIITSIYHKPRDSNTTGHSGIDVVPLRSDGSVDTNSSVLSISSGTVFSDGYHNGFGPHTVIIKTDSGTYITYGHMSSENVSVGSRVNVGTPLGIVGSLGNSTGVHIHVQEAIGGPFPTSPGFEGFVNPQIQP